MKYLISFVERLSIVVFYAVVIALTCEFVGLVWDSYSSFPLRDFLVVVGGFFGACLAIFDIVANRRVAHLFLPSMKRLLIYEGTLIAFSAVAAFVGWVLEWLFHPTIFEVPLWFVFMMTGFAIGVLTGGFFMDIRDNE